MERAVLDSVPYRFLDSSVPKEPNHPTLALDRVAVYLAKYPLLRDVLLDRLTSPLRDYLRRDFRDRDPLLEACITRIRSLSRHREPREAFLKWIMPAICTGKLRGIDGEANAQDPLPGIISDVVAQILEPPEKDAKESIFPVASHEELVDIVTERALALTAPPHWSWLFRTLSPAAAAVVAFRIHERMVEHYAKAGSGLPRFNSERDEKMSAIWPLLCELGLNSRTPVHRQAPAVVKGLVQLVKKYEREVIGGIARAESSSRYIMAYVSLFLGSFPEILEYFLSSLFSATTSRNMTICLSADMATGFSLLWTRSRDLPVEDERTRATASFASYAFTFFQEGLTSHLGGYDPAKVLARSQAMALEREGLLANNEEIARLAANLTVTPGVFRTAVSNLCNLAQAIAGTLATWSHAHATAAMMSQVVSSNACRPQYTPSDAELARQREAVRWTASMMDGLWKLAFEPSAAGAAGAATLSTGPDAVGEVLESCLVALGDEMRNPFTVAAVEQGIDFSGDGGPGQAGAADPVLVQRFMRTVSIGDFGEDDWGLIIGPSDKNVLEAARKSPPEKRARILFSLLLALPMLTRRSRPTATATWKGIRRLLESDDHRTSSVALEIFAEIGLVDAKMRESDKVLVVEALAERTLRTLDGLAESGPAKVGEFIGFSKALRKCARSFSSDEFAHCYFINYLLDRLLVRLPASLETVITRLASSEFETFVPDVSADPSRMPPDLVAKAPLLSSIRRRSVDGAVPNTAFEASVRALSVGDRHKPLPRAGRSLVATAPQAARGWVVSDQKLAGKKRQIEEINRALAELETGAGGTVESVLVKERRSEFLRFKQGMRTVFRLSILSEDALAKEKRPAESASDCAFGRRLALSVQREFETIAAHFQNSGTTRVVPPEPLLDSRPAPDGAIEWELCVRRYFVEHPHLWIVLEVLAEANSLFFCKKILLFLLVALIHRFSRGVEKDDRRWDTFAANQVVVLFSKAGLLPSPLNLLPMVFPVTEPAVIGELLRKVVWACVNDGGAPSSVQQYVQHIARVLRRLLGKPGKVGKEAVKLYVVFST